MKIWVASANPVKIEASKLGVETFFPDEELHMNGLPVASGVSDQPFGDEETRLGALQRCRHLNTLYPDDLSIGIEGGLEKTAFGMLAFAWVCVARGKKRGLARSGSFFIPDKVAQLVGQGMELGEANDIYYKKENSKQQMGALGLLSNGRLTRTDLYRHAVELAIVQLLS
jgi:inosine/xanthosine triphosphatase